MEFKRDIIKYVVVFLITVSIFFSVFYISDKISSSRLEKLSDLQEKMSLSILSTETRFALLKESSCSDIFLGSELEIGVTKELNNLVSRIKFLESELGSDNSDVLYLKERYSLLQIKDYLLVKELSNKCGYNITTVLYFNGEDCAECKNQSIVLDAIREENDNVRVYWFDGEINVATVDILETLFNINSYPALVIGDETYETFLPYNELKEVIKKWSDDNNALVSEEKDESEE
jgi:hypothetical protein